MTELGLGTTGATLASRVLGAPHFIVTNEKRWQTGLIRYWQEPLFPDGTFIPGLLGWNVDHRFFPYGIPVEPDAPL